MTPRHRVPGRLAATLALALLLVGAHPSTTPTSLEREWTSALAALRAHSRTLDGFADLHRLLWLRAHLVDTTALDALVDHIAEDPRSFPALRDHARALAARRARRAGDDARARRLLADTGLVTRFWLLGPLDNTGGSGLAGLPVDPDLLDLSAPAAGKLGPVSWRRVEAGDTEGYLDLGALLDPADEVAALLLFEIEAPRAVDLALRLGTTDQLCLHVGTLPRRCFDERHAWSFEQHAVGLHVAAGRTPVLVQLGSLDRGFKTTVRLTALDGSAVPTDVRVALPEPATPLQMKGHAVTARSVLDLIPALEARAQGRRGNQRADALVDLARTQTALHASDLRADPTPQAVVLRQALTLRPDDAWVLLLLGHALSVHDPNAGREAFERALRVNPQLGPAHLALGKHRQGRMLYHEALPSLRQAHTLEPGDPLALLTLVETLRERDPDDDEARELIERFVHAHRTTTGVAGGPEVARRWMHDLEEAGRHREARELATAMLEHDATDSGALRVLLHGAEVAGDLERVLALQRRFIACDPQAPGPRLRLAHRLAWNDRHDEATRLLEEMAQRFPDHAEFSQALGETRLLAGDRDGAARAWQRSLARRPQQPELRRRLEALTRASDTSMLPAIDVTALRRLQVPDSARAFGAVVLQQRSVTRLFENGLYRTDEEISLRLLDAGRAEVLRKQGVPYSPGREIASVQLAERIDARGLSLPPDRVRDSGSSGRSQGVYSDRAAMVVEFGELQTGDIVRVRSRVEAVGEVNLFGDFFGQILTAQRQWPVLHYSHTVLAPRSRPLYVHVQGLRHEVEDDGGPWIAHHFTVDNLPGHPIEPLMPPWLETVPWFSVSTYQSWEEMLHWYAQLIEDQYQLDDSTRALAQHLVDGVALDDTRERVRRIHDHVVKKTRYVGIELGIHGWKPYRASVVHRRGYGDCKDKATLLVAMLGEVGVEARLVLLRTVNLGELAREPASMWAFNHAIAYVPALDLYLDGTAEFSGLDELPTVDQGAMALRVGRDGSGELVHIPLQPAARNLNTSEYRIALDDKGTARLSGTERFWGARAARLRRQFEDPATRQEHLEREVSEGFAGAVVHAVEFSDLDDLNAEVWYRFEASLPARAQPVDGGWRLPISLYPHGLASAYASSPQRRTDLVLDHPWRTRNVMHYTLPPGVRGRALPQPVRITTPHLVFEQRIEATAEGVLVDEVTELPSRRVPVADYQGFREACLRADAAMQQRLELVRSPQTVGGAP
ncbi:MAG: DUF3857 domain-containing protein [Pseudomonadota bacterium]